MADVVATLDRSGHRGQITAISRRGLRSHGHPAIVAEPYGNFASVSSLTPSQLVRRIREVIRAASRERISWQAVLDAVRRDAPGLWAALTVRDRRRIVRHLRVFWDVHRFRIAPQIEAVLDRRLRGGTLEIVAASIRSAAALPDGLRIDITRRRSAATEQLVVDHVIVCTGPAHGQILASLPYLAALAHDGWIAADPLRLGIHADRNSRALDNTGKPVPAPLHRRPSRPRHVRRADGRARGRSAHASRRRDRQERDPGPRIDRRRAGHPRRKIKGHAHGASQRRERGLSPVPLRCYFAEACFCGDQISASVAFTGFGRSFSAKNVSAIFCCSSSAAAVTSRT